MRDPEPATGGGSTLAELADRHRLYERAVQCPRAEVDFIDRNYRLLRGHSARVLREDFCGTAAVGCEWVRRRKGNRALAVDLDGEVLAWGRTHNLSRLAPEPASRVTLLQANVQTVSTPPADIIAAMNFSYWLLGERAALAHYFRKVHRDLKDDGVFFLDAYGGYDAYRVVTEERQVRSDGLTYTYIWEQERYDPISGALVCHIHFAFPDGSRLERAFSYQWRLWSLPEIRELLAEAGFRRVLCYWQGWNPDGTPDGQFVPVEEGEPDAGWVAYLSAEK
ncbi:MAG: class I SAM-dependent methyltransferase [Chromatiaceae bacterium]|jgi:hypothetical protein|nr:class I SAM-dependent methyltransferase [Chromatiaceae bacterium]